MQINCIESKPYIFVSYAHKDSDKVYPILERLSNAGFNIWYDKGIEAGSTWDDNIALHIDTSAYFMAFISENYLNSSNCKDEISYARDLNKDMLLIYLEEVALPSGMAMRLNRNQAVIWNELDDAYTGEDFSKILNAKGISKTLINKTNSEFSFPENATEATSFQRAAAPTTVSEAIPPVSQALRTENTNAGKNINRRVAIISAVAIGTVGLVVGLIIIFSLILKGSLVKKNYWDNDYEYEADFDDDFYEDESDEDDEYEDALDAELVGFDYYVKNDTEYEESHIVYWAQIKNPNPDVFIEDVTLKLTIRGEDGAIITTSENYYSDIISGDTISVWGRVNSVYDGENASPEATCEILSTEFGEKESSEKTVYSDIEFFNISSRPGDYESIIITGEVNYNTKSDDDYLYAIVVFNKGGKCVFTDTIALSNMKPGKTQAFSTELFTEIPEYDEVILLPQKAW